MDRSAITDEAFCEIFQSTSEGIIMDDEMGKIATANPVAEQILRYSKEELNGMLLEDLVPNPYRTRLVTTKRLLTSILSREEWGLEGILPA